MSNRRDRADEGEAECRTECGLDLQGSNPPECLEEPAHHTILLDVRAVAGDGAIS